VGGVVGVGLPLTDVVRFDMNTVPWQLPVTIAGEPLSLNEYPDGSYRELVAAIAAYCGQPESRVVVGAGADELISLVAQAYLDGTRHFAVSDPSYAMFSIASLIAGASPISVASDATFALDRSAFAAAAARADVTWIANPGNPTGELLPQDYLREVAASARGIVVVDEAYAEFAGTSALDWISGAPNVAVLRTLSKAFALAGMRVGYLVAAPEVVAILHKLRPPASISAVSARMAVAALHQAAGVRTRVRALVAARHRFGSALAATGRPVIEGAANFVLTPVDDATAARALARGLVLRTYDPGHRLHGWSRITVRSPEDNARLLRLLS